MEILVSGYLCNVIRREKPVPRNKVSLLLTVFITAFSLSSFSQDITVRNPSLEGKAKQNASVDNWEIASTTPDIQPGIFNIDLTPSDGKTYVGFHGGETWLEGVAQKLSSTMKADFSYSISFDLAFTPVYSSKACYGSMVIYGGNTASDTAEVLWESGEFEHTDWKRYTATLKPSHDYKYLSFWTRTGSKCDKSAYGIAFLLDNISPVIKQLPQVSFAIKNACKGEQSGIIVANVTGGQGPYTYRWNPGNYNTNSVSGLSPGEYSVTVNSANGTSVKGNVIIKESDLSSVVNVSTSLCYGDNQSRITVNTTGGQAPYQYYLDGLQSKEPEFNNLGEGSYKLVVKDNLGCQNVISDIHIDEPAPLKIVQSVAESVSCSDVQNGKIIINVTGGTAPFMYSVPGYVAPQESFPSGLEAGKYHYRVTDSHNCSIDGDAEITKQSRDCMVTVPTAFSPNGDGQNDVFRAKVHDDVSNFRLAVYGRWGGLVFESVNPSQGWNGTFKSIRVPEGPYVWVLTYTDSKHQDRKQQGSLLLMR